MGSRDGGLRDAGVLSPVVEAGVRLYLLGTVLGFAMYGFFCFVIALLTPYTQTAARLGERFASP